MRFDSNTILRTRDEESFLPYLPCLDTASSCSGDMSIYWRAHGLRHTAYNGLGAGTFDLPIRLGVFLTTRDFSFPRASGDHIIFVTSLPTWFVLFNVKLCETFHF